jgi:hypothetical protein
MSTSTNAILAYGYDLGGADDDWKVREAGEYGELALDWFDAEDDDADFITVAEKRLLAASGFTETDWHADGYFDRQREAEARLGVEIESYCSNNFPMYLLAAKVITVRRGYVETVDPAELTVVPAEWDEKLSAALGVLGLTPLQERARWLLCSFWA